MPMVELDFVLLQYLSGCSPPLLCCTYGHFFFSYSIFYCYHWNLSSPAVMCHAASYKYSIDVVLISNYSSCQSIEHAISYSS